MIKQNFLKQKLVSGKIVLGTWMVTPSVILADIVSGSGLDFVIIDSEHGPINFETAQSMIIASENNGVSSVIRVSGVNEAEILKALDIGAHCVQIPNVSSLEMAQEAVAYSKYPPFGKRGFSPFNRAGQYSLKQVNILTKDANENSMVAIHVESADALDKIDEVLSVDKIDIIFLGLYDISKSLGIPGEINNPKVSKMMQAAIKKICNAGKYCGTIATDFDQLKKIIDDGVQYITFSADCEVLKNSFEQIVDNFKKITAN